MSLCALRLQPLAIAAAERARTCARAGGRARPAGAAVERGAGAKEAAPPTRACRLTPLLAGPPLRKHNCAGRGRGPAGNAGPHRVGRPGVGDGL